MFVFYSDSLRRILLIITYLTNGCVEAILIVIIFKRGASNCEIIRLESNSYSFDMHGCGVVTLLI